MSNIINKSVEILSIMIRNDYGDTRRLNEDTINEYGIEEFHKLLVEDYAFIGANAILKSVEKLDVYYNFVKENYPHHVNDEPKGDNIIELNPQQNKICCILSCISDELYNSIDWDELVKIDTDKVVYLRKMKK